MKVLKPRWFRGRHGLGTWLASYSGQCLGRGLLLLFFITVITPLGSVLRLAGKDSLQLKRRREAKTYWREAKDCSPLNRLY